MDETKDRLTILHIMFASYPNVTVTEGMLANYLRLLRHVPLEALQVATDRCVAECKFPPTIADILERYNETKQRVSLDMTPQEIASRSFNYGRQLYRESDEERRERIRRLENRERRYGH